jgi:predicted ferric reductase
MKVKLKSREQIGNFLKFDFDTQGQNVSFMAGQFFNLTLINPPHTDERGNSRHFGFTNSTLETNIISMLTKIGVSAFKKYLIEMPLGTEAEIDGINGHKRFPDNTNQPLTWITDSVGIAPFMSVIREVKGRSLPNKISLIYFNKTNEDAIFFDELDNYSKENQLFKFIPITSNIQIISPDLIKTQATKYQNISYIVTGEPNFVISNIKALKEAGIEQANIAMEIFTGY